MTATPKHMNAAEYTNWLLGKVRTFDRSANTASTKQAHESALAARDGVLHKLRLYVGEDATAMLKMELDENSCWIDPAADSDMYVPTAEEADRQLFADLGI